MNLGYEVGKRRKKNARAVKAAIARARQKRAASRAPNRAANPAPMDSAMEDMEEMEEGDEEVSGYDGQYEILGDDEIIIGAKFFKKALGPLGKIAKAVGPTALKVAVPGAGPALALAGPIVKAAKAGNPKAKAKIAQISAKAAAGDPKAAIAVDVIQAAAVMQASGPAVTDPPKSPSRNSGGGGMSTAKRLRLKYGL